MFLTLKQTQMATTADLCQSTGSDRPYRLAYFCTLTFDATPITDCAALIAAETKPVITGVVNRNKQPPSWQARAL